MISLITSSTTDLVSTSDTILRSRRGHDRMAVGLQLSTLSCKFKYRLCEMYSIQHYM
jgi:hypothetical protein